MSVGLLFLSYAVEGRGLRNATMNHAPQDRRSENESIWEDYVSNEDTQAGARRSAKK